MKAVVLPKMCENMENGVIVSLYKSAGDRFSDGEPLFAVEVKKVVFEVEAQGSGTVTAVLCGEGSQVRPGEPVMEIRGDTPLEAGCGNVL